MLDVSDIKLLQKVTELGSINKAADELYMSQPTLSKRISRLEQTLNVKLFFRHSSGMQPTDVTNYLIKTDSWCRPNWIQCADTLNDLPLWKAVS